MGSVPGVGIAVVGSAVEGSTAGVVGAGVGGDGVGDAGVGGAGVLARFAFLERPISSIAPRSSGGGVVVKKSPASKRCGPLRSLSCSCTWLHGLELPFWQRMSAGHAARWQGKHNNQ